MRKTSGTVNRVGRMGTVDRDNLNFRIRDIFGANYSKPRVGTGESGEISKRSYRTEQHTHPQQRIISSKISTVLRLRNPDIEKVLLFHPSKISFLSSEPKSLS